MRNPATEAARSSWTVVYRPSLRPPATATVLVVVWMPPPEEVACTLIVYVSSGSVVGSRVASVAGGVPAPELRVMTGEPGVAAWTVTCHELIVSPAGGVMSAVTGTDAVTRVPSAGAGAPITGAGAGS